MSFAPQVDVQQIFFVEWPGRKFTRGGKIDGPSVRRHTEDARDVVDAPVAWGSGPPVAVRRKVDQLSRVHIELIQVQVEFTGGRVGRQSRFAGEENPFTIGGCF